MTLNCSDPIFSSDLRLAMIKARPGRRVKVIKKPAAGDLSFPLRPLRSASDYDRAVEVAGSLAGHELNPEQDDYLGTLGALIVAYEDQTQPFEMPQMSGLDALKGLLRDHGMNASDLSRLLGAHRSLGSKILHGERSLTVQHLRILTEYFKVSADLFLPAPSSEG